MEQLSDMHEVILMADDMTKKDFLEQVNTLKKSDLLS